MKAMVKLFALGAATAVALVLSAGVGYQRDRADLAGSVFNAVSHQDRVTVSAVGAVAMASWVTRCWSPTSIAGVARPEPDVPEAPLVRAGRRLPVARPHLVRDLAGRALLLGEVGTRPEASPGHRQGRCHSPSPIPGPRRRFCCTRTAREPIPSRCATGRLIDRTVCPVAPHKRPARAVLASPPTCPA